MFLPVFQLSLDISYVEASGDVRFCVVRSLECSSHICWWKKKFSYVLNQQSYLWVMIGLFSPKISMKIIELVSDAITLYLIKTIFIWKRYNKLHKMKKWAFLIIFFVIFDAISNFQWLYTYSYVIDHPTKVNKHFRQCVNSVIKTTTATTKIYHCTSNAN